MGHSHAGKTIAHLSPSKHKAFTDLQGLNFRVGPCRVQQLQLAICSNEGMLTHLFLVETHHNKQLKQQASDKVILCPLSLWSDFSPPVWGNLRSFHVPSPLWDLEYADDAVLLSCSATQLNRPSHPTSWSEQRTYSYSR